MKKFLKEEAVLSAAVVLAVVSAFFVLPDSEYISYIDWHTLFLLFSLMGVMAGFRQAGFFAFLGGKLLGKVNSTCKMDIVLVMLPFVFSMIITNDVALITFVPFAITVLKMSKQEEDIVQIVVLQTIAANLGSMLTPMGNPQNLYLFSRSGAGLVEFMGVMLPYFILSAVCIFGFLLGKKSQRISNVNSDIPSVTLKDIYIYIIGFVICLGCVLKFIQPYAAALIIFVYLLIKDRNLLKKIDYSLLLTFIAFFIFIGNMGRMEAFRNVIQSLINGREMIWAVITSQVISNVPAALLLSGFTDNWRALAIGCNIGGLGTLIASMASLISYKLIAKECSKEKKRYFKSFTIYNIVILVILLVFHYSYTSF